MHYVLCVPVFYVFFLFCLSIFFCVLWATLPEIKLMMMIIIIKIIILELINNNNNTWFMAL